MIIALTGSCWSSCCSTRNSRERCRARARDSLSPVAMDVVSPHAGLELMPVLTESLSPVLRESLVWTLRERDARRCCSGPPASLWPCPVLREDPSLVDRDVASQLA